MRGTGACSTAGGGIGAVALEWENHQPTTDDFPLMALHAFEDG